MKIGIHELKMKPGTQLKFSLEESWRDIQVGRESIPVVAPVRVEGELTNTGKFIYLKGHAWTELELACARCLEVFVYPLEVPLEEEYCTEAVFQSLPETDTLRDEVRVYEGDILDLRPAVEEAFILALPMKWVCREECRGLCPWCGKNLNTEQCNCRGEEVDPRLLKLSELLSQNKGGC
ncbi:YceD family protein [Thermanaeromonas sp.]|uniref:YceD family protein n=1 Tax=Thermanaeromonas sp. TaxID=2003697 RepID=UPI00260A6BAF|nr:DUF177 domain-containing protein [Thermanaeromonas sp.]